MAGELVAVLAVAGELVGEGCSLGMVEAVGQVGELVVEGHS
jgi:hypothetical protein